MGIIKSSKVATKKEIKGGETFDVKITLESEPNIMDNPKDIALVLDKSGSMTGQPLEGLKIGASHFADVIDKSTDGQQDGIFGNGSKIGVVSFSSTATIDQALSSMSNDIKLTVNAMTTSGSTDHQDAFLKGIQLLESSTSKNEKILVLFTDGESNAGKEGFAEAQAAKDKGITVYCIGYGDPQRLDMEALKKWASAPADDHVLIAPTYQDINDTFDKLAATISEPKATNIVFTDKVNPCFEILSVKTVSKGVANILDKNTIEWKLDDLGAKNFERVLLHFTVKYICKERGTFLVNESHSYTDREGNTIALPDPTINVVGDDTAVVVDAPIETDIVMDGCKDYVEFDASNIVMDNIGRMLSINTTIKDVCPNKDVALGVILSEIDVDGIEHQRGSKVVLVPGHTNTTCSDILVKCIRFVLPEALDEQGSPTSLCNDRLFRARFYANYVASDYQDCK